MPIIATRSRNNVPVLLLLACAAIAVIWVFTHRDRSSTDAVESFLVQPPRPLPEFQLIDADNVAFTRSRLEGKWTFMFFGYTHCPDVCPATLSEMAKVYQLLQELPDTAKHVQVVLISVDPARDSSAQLKNYIQYFNRLFIAATGPLENLDVLTSALGVHNRRLTDEGPEYRVEHSADLWLIDPQTRLYAKLPAPHYAEEVANHFVELKNSGEPQS